MWCELVFNKAVTEHFPLPGVGTVYSHIDNVCKQKWKNTVICCWLLPHYLRKFRPLAKWKEDKDMIIRKLIYYVD